jgi:K+-sensing histidine kinase KdpD
MGSGRSDARFRFINYLAAVATAIGCTIVSLLGATVLQTAAFLLVFPVGVLYAATRFGVGPSILTAFGGAVVFDFVFVPPAWAFAVPGLKDGLTLAVMAAVAAVASILAEQLRKQAHRASRRADIEQLRNALLSSLSHDLRTPLTTLVGASAALCEDRLEPGQRMQFSRMVADESVRLNRLVDVLLELTRLESARAESPRSLQSVEEVIGSALSRLERRLEGRDVSTHVADGVPLIAFDPLLIEQVVINLVENVLRHAGSASPIEVTAKLAGREILVEVADRGPGVREGEEERLFEKLYRGRGTVAGDGGFGLGLSICRAILIAHDGRIWLGNRPGGGAAVRFTLPLASTRRSFRSADSALAEGA